MNVNSDKRYYSRAKPTVDEEQEIIQYYLLPRNLRATADKFHRGIPVIKQVLLKHNIEFHSDVTKKQCASQKSKETCLEKYGVEFTFQSKNNKEKSKKSVLDKYGVDNPAKSKLIQDKMKQTCLKKYGVENYSQTNDYLKKQKLTCQEKYGAESYIQSNIYKQRYTEIQEKTKQTNLKKFGTEWYSQTDDGKQKIIENTKKSIFALYGVEYYAQSEDFKQKVIKTNNKKYGVDYYSQTDEFNKQIAKNYNYKTELFDSLPELCFYLYNIANNKNIERCPESFEYYYNNKKHLYFPDFEVDGQLYEIKGGHFLKKDGTWQNPFDHSLDDLFESKHQCALANNVKILYPSDYKKYVNWFYDQGFKKEDFMKN